MEFFMAGLLLIILGCSLIFAREMWWAVQEVSNQIQGRASERTDLWDLSQIVVGAIVIVLGIFVVTVGLSQMNKPVVPALCSGVTSEFDTPLKLDAMLQRKRNTKLLCLISSL
jgi:uncharacterized membrane protein